MLSAASKHAQCQAVSAAFPADDNMIDIPVPDFTYVCYPETRYKNSSWPAIRELLYRKSQMVNWEDRKNDIFHRWAGHRVCCMWAGYKCLAVWVSCVGAHVAGWLWWLWLTV